MRGRDWPTPRLRFTRPRCREVEVGEDCGVCRRRGGGGGRATVLVLGSLPAVTALPLAAAPPRASVIRAAASALRLGAGAVGAAGPGSVVEGVVDADEDAAEHVAGATLHGEAARALLLQLVCERDGRE